ncbi:hypothetical protein BVY04_01065, partial [bacterium M21]
HSREHTQTQCCGLFTFISKFHPVAVHFPIALVIMALVAEILFALTRKDLFDHSAHFLLPAGAAAAIPAAMLGLLAAASANYPAPLSDILQQHRWFGLGAAIVTLTAAVLQRFSARKTTHLWVYRAALLIAVLLISYTSHLGGTLIYGIDYFKL